jgi:signal transduction histidine kinase
LEEAAEIREFLSKLTSIIGRHAVAPARVSVPRLLAGVRAAVLRKYPQIDVRLFAPSRAKVVCHPEEISQVLSHLMQNAVEAISPPDNRVTLRAVEGNDCVIISVEDTGTGIDPRVERKVFDPFFSTKRGHDGMGLYFCRLIVERNSGSIEMRRPPEGGTQAMVVLPTDMGERSGTPDG